ncbi:hypothetical protein [Soonwooa sp.]|uniref:hypothetical protein n=1 Tax=Soonwooa sp. TaxID=1938592 RepID=UPI0028B1781A|nr:hypothetical protein [Soonwooa sp.]
MKEVGLRLGSRMLIEFSMCRITRIFVRPFFDVCSSFVRPLFEGEKLYYLDV